MAFLSTWSRWAVKCKYLYCKKVVSVSSSHFHGHDAWRPHAACPLFARTTAFKATLPFVRVLFPCMTDSSWSQWDRLAVPWLFFSSFFTESTASSQHHQHVLCLREVIPQPLGRSKHFVLEGYLPYSKELSHSRIPMHKNHSWMKWLIAHECRSPCMFLW